MQKRDFIADVLNEIFDDDPMAVLLPVDGQALVQNANTTQVLTSHTMFGGSDFLPTDSPSTIATKLIRVCIAELAAKGAVARNCSLVVSLHESVGEQWTRSFGEGLASELTEFGLTLVHCETKDSNGNSMLSMSCVGELIGEPMSAANATPGDLVCLSGQVGMAALGRKINDGLDLGIKEYQAERYLSAFQQPEPNWALGSFLVEQAKAKTAINISKGFVPALRKLAAISNVAINVDFSSLTVADNSLPIGPQLFDSADNQLLICMSPSSVGMLLQWFPQVAIVGHVLAGDGVRFVDGNGAPIEIERLEEDTF